jgi:hypothetical protein
MKTQIGRRSVLLLILAAFAPTAHADLLVRVDCAHRVLPKQAAVAAALGIHNLDQAYRARVKLMGEVNRACHRAAGGQVDLVLQAPHESRRIPHPVAASSVR